MREGGREGALIFYCVAYIIPVSQKVLHDVVITSRGGGIPNLPRDPYNNGHYQQVNKDVIYIHGSRAES